MEWFQNAITDPATIAFIATTILLLVGMIAGGKYLLKFVEGTKLLTLNLENVSIALKESVDPFKAFTAALQDNKFTAEEVDQIIQEINQAKGAWKDVFANKN